MTRQLTRISVVYVPCTDVGFHQDISNKLFLTLKFFFNVLMLSIIAHMFQCITCRFVSLTFLVFQFRNVANSLEKEWILSVVFEKLAVLEVMIFC